MAKKFRLYNNNPKHRLYGNTVDVTESTAECPAAERNGWVKQAVSEDGGETWNPVSNSKITSRPTSPQRNKGGRPKGSTKAKQKEITD